MEQMEPHGSSGQPNQPGHAGSATRMAIRQHSVGDIERSFEELREYLKDVKDHRNLSYSIRVAVLLEVIGSRNKIASTVKSGFTDYWLPVSESCVPVDLSPGEYDRFLKAQPSFLDNSFDLNGRHHHLSQHALSKERPIVPQSLKWISIIGQGGYADVSKVESTDGKFYALKRIRRHNRYDDAMAQMKSVKEELEVLKRIDHYHCVKLMGSYADLAIVGIVMDPVADCNLDEFLDNFSHSNPVDQQVILASFFGCLATALEYLHYKMKIRHKDIKPRNILVKANRLMLTDFGISLDWSESGHTTTLEEQRRSPVYCAPEAAEAKPRDSNTDIWSLGCVFLEMAAVLKGRPRSFVHDTLKNYGSKNFRDCPQGIEESIITLEAEGKHCDDIPLMWVRAMLQRAKDARPNSRQLKRMSDNCGIT